MKLLSLIFLIVTLGGCASSPDRAVASDEAGLQINEIRNMCYYVFKQHSLTENRLAEVMQRFESKSGLLPYAGAMLRAVKGAKPALYKKNTDQESLYLALSCEDHTGKLDDLLCKNGLCKK